MGPLRDAMDAVADRAAPVDHYDELAPVYDFVLARRYDHDALAEFVDDHLADDATAVCVGGCGSGRLLARLADRYEDAVGVDASPAMCDLAAARTDAAVVEADVREYREAGRFDGYALLGNSVAHLPPGDVPSFLATARECLAPGGVLVADFTLAGTLANGHVTRDAFESGRVRVERTVVVTLEDRDPAAPGTAARYTYRYELADRRVDETVVTGTSVPVRAYRAPTVLGAAMAAGFAEVTIVDPPTPHGGGLVARRAG